MAKKNDGFPDVKILDFLCPGRFMCRALLKKPVCFEIPPRMCPFESMIKTQEFKTLMEQASKLRFDWSQSDQMHFSEVLDKTGAREMFFNLEESFRKLNRESKKSL